MVPSMPLLRELAISGDHVIGSHEWRKRGECVDLAGRCVLPGFTDAHVHFPMWSMYRRWLSLAGCASLEDVVQRVAAASIDTPRDRWLIGFDWAADDWRPARVPSRSDLDRVTGDVPVALWSKDLHSLWLNSAGIAAAAGDLGSHPIVERDAVGEPTGLLREQAAWDFRSRHIRLSADEYADAVVEGVGLAHARGVTAVHDKDGWLGAPEIWRRVRDRGSLTLRVWQSVPADQMTEYDRDDVENGFLRVGYLKVFMDGSLGSGTALMLDGSGLAVTTEEELVEIITTASAAGWPVAVHAIGDRANRDALNAFEATHSSWRPRALRQRIEHAQHLHPDDIARFGNLGIACSVQFTDAARSRDAVDRLDDHVAEGTFAFGSLWDSGAVIVNGSDAPLTELDPLLGLRGAVLRTFDDRPPWRPDQALTIEQALQASIVNPVWLSGDEHRRGVLWPGYLADLVVLDRDPVECPLDKLDDIGVVATMVGGRWVHNPPPWD